MTRKKYRKLLRNEKKVFELVENLDRYPDRKLVEIIVHILANNEILAKEYREALKTINNQNTVNEKILNQLNGLNKIMGFGNTLYKN